LGTEFESENEKKRKRDEFEALPANNGSLSIFDSAHTSKDLHPSKKPKLSALDDIKLREEAKKDKQNRKDYWLAPDIVVKVLNKTVGDGKFYKQKAVVLKVEELYRAMIKVLDTGAKLIIDQRDLETVIPVCSCLTSVALPLPYFSPEQRRERAHCEWGL